MFSNKWYQVRGTIVKDLFSSVIKNNDYVHIFYNITEKREYLDKLIGYIISGIEQNEHILVIESERLIHDLNKELAVILTKEQLSYVHTVNNFDYYFSTGSFQPTVIFDNLTKILTPFVEDNVVIRCWAHVEWGEQEGIFNILDEFEREADDLVRLGGMSLVCAYDGERIPDTLKTSLMTSHKFIIKGNNIVESHLYLTKEAN